MADNATCVSLLMWPTNAIPINASDSAAFVIRKHGWGFSYILSFPVHTVFNLIIVCSHVPELHFEVKLFTGGVFWDYQSTPEFWISGSRFGKRSVFSSPPCPKRNRKQSLRLILPSLYFPPRSEVDAQNGVCQSFAITSLSGQKNTLRKNTSVPYLIDPSKGAPMAVASCFPCYPSILYCGIAV